MFFETGTISLFIKVSTVRQMTIVVRLELEIILFWIRSTSYLLSWVWQKIQYCQASRNNQDEKINRIQEALVA